MTDDMLDNAYQACLRSAQSHYENFPTATRLLAKPQQLATAAIYAFARTADDIADEGSLSPGERHARLDVIEAKLAQIENGNIPEDPLFLALADTIQQYQLPTTPFKKLLQAFRSDIDTRRYPSYTELAHYCTHSANPVGELILRLHDNWNKVTEEYSNHICTALQLINFIQDLDSDYQQRRRLYIPLDEMQQYHVEEADIANRRQTDQLANLIRYQLKRTADLLEAGTPLLSHCHGRLRFILKLTVYSGQRMQDKLMSRHNSFTRPCLRAGDIALIAFRSLLFQPGKRT